MNRTDIAAGSSPHLRRLGSWRWAALGMVCLCAVGCFLWVDEGLSRWIYTRLPAWPAQPWPMGFRQLGKAWVTLWLLLLWFAASRQSRPVLCGVLALVLTLPWVWPLKQLVGRARPGDALAQSQAVSATTPLTGHSFPSGDTATVFAVTSALAGFVRWPWLCLLFLGALGVGLLRVVILAHYLSDVCVGMAIGLCCGVLAQHLERRLSLIPTWLERQAWTVPLALCLVPSVMWLCEGAGPVLVFFETFGILAIGLALFYRLYVLRRRHQ